MDKEVKRLVKLIIKDAQDDLNATIIDPLIHGLVTIIYKLHESLQLTEVFDTEKQKYFNHEIKLIEASIIAKTCLDVAFMKYDEDEEEPHME